MKKLISTALLSLACSGAYAGVIFSDNFDSETPLNLVQSGSDTNFNNFTQWSVSNGTVDLVANGDWGLQCAGGAGKCVDLDGSNGNAGTLSSTNFALAAGNYVLSFAVSGNQRGGASDSMTLALGGFINDSISLSWNAPWQTVNYAFTVNSASNNFISFNHDGGDNIGIMLDNVSLATSVDEPASFALLALGLLGLGAARRHKK